MSDTIFDLAEHARETAVCELERLPHLMLGPDKRRTQAIGADPAVAAPRRVAEEHTGLDRRLPPREDRFFVSERSARCALALAIIAAIWLPGLPFGTAGELWLTAINLALTVATVVIVLRVRATLVARLHRRHDPRERSDPS